MPSVSSAGLLVYRRVPADGFAGRHSDVAARPPAGGHPDLAVRAGAEVLLLAPPASMVARRQAVGEEAAARRGVRPPRGAHRVPSWEWQARTARPPGSVAAAELSIEERLRSRPRTRKPSNEQLLETARRGFTADLGLLLEPPFASLGGVKQHHHRLLYVWAREIDDADVETIVRTLADPRAAVLLDLTEAREVVVAPQRRFIDQLHTLLATGGVADT